VATCADVSAATPCGWHDLVLPSGREEAAVLALVDEVIFAIDAGEGMPVGAEVTGTTDAGLAVRLRLADRTSVEPTGSVPKAASRSGLAVEHRPDGVRCTVLVDV
jgi:SHS2 domain-containing protein